MHAVWPRSRANGPGVRAVVWVQGCTLGCPGCFNPGTHGGSGAVERAVEELVAGIGDADGLTVSGGEPFQQPAGLLGLVRAARKRGLSVLVFSGYERGEIEGLPLGREILDRVDVLVAGRYVAAARSAAGLLGSANQRIHFLTDRYGPDDLAATPEAEVRIAADGSLEFSGVDPLRRR